MNNTVNLVAGVLAIIAVLAMCLSMALVIVYAFEKAAYDQKLEEMRKSGVGVAKDGDE